MDSIEFDAISNSSIVSGHRSLMARVGWSDSDGCALWQLRWFVCLIVLNERLPLKVNLLPTGLRLVGYKLIPSSRSPDWVQRWLYLFRLETSWRANALLEPPSWNHCNVRDAPLGPLAESIKTDFHRISHSVQRGLNLVLTVHSLCPLSSLWMVGKCIRICNCQQIFKTRSRWTSKHSGVVRSINNARRSTLWPYTQVHQQSIRSQQCAFMFGIDDHSFRAHCPVDNNDSSDFGL